jgi:hypothetical protein
MASSPYFQFGAQRRYPFAWHGGPGGVPQSRVAGESRELSNVDLEESGLNPYSMPYPAFGRTRLHSVGDWPAVRPAGPEPLDPGGLGSTSRRMGARRPGDWHSVGSITDLSDNEKKLAMLVAAGAVGIFLWKRSKRGRRR